MTARVLVDGARFGRWVVLQRLPRSYAVARCDCGRERRVYLGNLRSGTSKSCGCSPRKARKHGHKPQSGASKEYRAYYNMLRRCYDRASKDYPSYGGRGITVCGAWRDSFDRFLSDVGPAPSPKHSIDRIDNSQGYEPGNVRWATRSQQNNNKRNVRLFTLDGVTMTLREWCDECGVSMTVTRLRLKYGWDLRRALTEPVREWGPGRKRCQPQ